MDLILIIIVLLLLFVGGFAIRGTVTVAGSA